MENTQKVKENVQQVNGCIKSLTYQQNSEQNNQVLQQITLDTLRDGSITLTSSGISSLESVKPEFIEQKFLKIENLNDFQETFQEAANFEHGVVLAIDHEAGRIISLSIFPRQCVRQQQLRNFTLGGPGVNPGCIPGWNC